MTADEREALRGRRISAIFQDHTASLDPLMSVGAQVQETCLAVDGSLSRREARARAIDLLARVGIPEPERRYRNYPHQFSGGQRQRVVIAIALAGSPDIIIADEPTSALDATVQKQVLQLLKTLVDETGVSVILVTHDMASAPKDGSRILVTIRPSEQGAAEVDLAYWSNGDRFGPEGWRAADSSPSRIIEYAEPELKCWMPMPSANLNRTSMD